MHITYYLHIIVCESYADRMRIICGSYVSHMRIICALYATIMCIMLASNTVFTVGSGGVDHSKFLSIKPIDFIKQFKEKVGHMKKGGKLRNIDEELTIIYI